MALGEDAAEVAHPDPQDGPVADRGQGAQGVAVFDTQEGHGGGSRGGGLRPSGPPPRREGSGAARGRKEKPGPAGRVMGHVFGGGGFC